MDEEIFFRFDNLINPKYVFSWFYIINIISYFIYEGHTELKKIPVSLNNSSLGFGLYSGLNDGPLVVHSCFSFLYSIDNVIDENKKYHRSVICSWTFIQYDLPLRICFYSLKSVKTTPPLILSFSLKLKFTNCNHCSHYPLYYIITTI